MIRSLRWRLVLVFGVVVTLALAIVLAGVGVVVERSLIEATATRLELGAGLLGQSRQGPGRPSVDLSDPALIRFLGGEGTAVAILDASGNELAAAANGATADVAGAHLTPDSYAAVLAGTATRREVLGSGDERVLVVAAPVVVAGRDGNGPPFIPPGQARRLGTTDDPPNAVVQLATSLAPVDREVTDVRLSLAAIALAALALALGLGVLLTGAALRPLQRVATAATLIAGGDLSARAGATAGDDEIGQVARAFDEMAGRVESLIRAQRRFAADASHEFRTPLTVLGGYVDVLTDDDSGDPADRGRVLVAMRREIDRLSRLAGDLLLLSQLEAGGQLRPRRFDLAELTADLGDAVRALASGHDVRFATDGPLMVEADPDRVTQALLNLVDNATRYGTREGGIRLATGRRGGLAVVSVENEGPPIPPEVLDRIFDRFYRGDGPDVLPPEGDGGHAGLGLAITKAVVVGSGGSIRAASDERGTRFTITLPLVR